jgi:hypothetical protein
MQKKYYRKYQKRKERLARIRGEDNKNPLLKLPELCFSKRSVPCILRQNSKSIL